MADEAKQGTETETVTTPADEQGSKETVTPPVDPEKVALEQQNTDLKKEVGRQGNEIGKMRSELDEARGQIPAPEEEGPVDYDAALADLESRYAEGEWDNPEDYRRLREDIVEQRTTERVLGQVEQNRDRNNFIENRGAFIAANPEFLELARPGGELDQLAATDPMLRMPGSGETYKYAAFHKWKANQSAASLTEAVEAGKTEGYDKRKQEEADLATGDRSAETLSDTGSSMHDKMTEAAPRTRKEMLSAAGEAYSDPKNK